MKKCLKSMLVLASLMFVVCGTVFAAEIPGTTLAALGDVQRYERAIHIMAMLLVGFGFLMVFVKKYGRSALTATYLLVSVAIPLYFRLVSRICGLHKVLASRQVYDIAPLAGTSSI